MTRKRKQIPREERLSIVNEYLKGDLTQKELAAKYGLKSRSSISNWMASFGITDISVPLPVKEIPGNQMGNKAKSERSREELEAELAKALEQVRLKEMEINALNVLIDIAEKNGMPVRKNSGAKQ